MFLRTIYKAGGLMKLVDMADGGKIYKDPKEWAKRLKKSLERERKIYWFHPGQVPFPLKLGIKLAKWMPGLFARGTIYILKTIGGAE